MKPASHGEKDKHDKNTMRPTRAVVNLGAVGHNVAKIRERIGKKRRLMAVVKADGYGHGALEVAFSAIKNGADCLGVAMPEEAEPLRNAGIDVPILVLGLVQPREAGKVVDSRLEQTICTLELAEALDRAGRSASTRVDVHVKVDTGMGRIGILPRDLVDFVRKLNRFEHLQLKGLYSHFAASDEEDQTFSEKQIRIFDEVIRAVEASGIHIPLKHMANSGAVLSLPRAYYDLVRPGIMIYGLYPSKDVPRTVSLIPAMTLKSRITHLKKVPAKTPVSYGRTFHTRRDTVVATVPVGYADGYSRGLSNQGFATINNMPAPLIGRVCMDMCMFDVTDIPNIRPGDEAVLFGKSPTVDEIAHRLGTINYEIVCAVGKRVPRVYESQRAVSSNGKPESM